VGSPIYDSPVAGELELYLFNSGTLVAGGVEAPVPFYLIRHPAGDVLVDGGNPAAVTQDPHAHWDGLADMFEVHMAEEEHCVPQLERIGVELESIRFVLQTHLHMDHTGALGHFPQASVIVHARELEAARAADSPLATGYVRADFERDELRWQPVEAETDLFDDGTIRLIETPGHSAGHMSLLLDLASTGRVLLTADAADNRDQWEGRAPPRALHSREDAARSIERLRALAAETDALVVLGHDLDDFSRHRHAPDHYS
jgi:N-acyl homoserine lactone hydrolase